MKTLLELFSLVEEPMEPIGQTSSMVNKSKLYSLYQKHAATLEKNKDLADKVRTLAFAIDRLNLDPAFSFEIQRGYSELLDAVSKALEAQTTSAQQTSQTQTTVIAPKY